MIDENFITEEEGLIAMDKPISLKPKQADEITRASFFSDSVKKELSELYGSDSVFENGIVVRTTLDPKLQDIAIKSFEKGIEEYDTKHGYRGSLGKIDSTGNWQENLQKFDPKKIYKETWQKAVVLSLSKDSATIGLENGEIGSSNFGKTLFKKSCTWFCRAVGSPLQLVWT